MWTIKQVEEYTTLCKASIYRLIQQGRFPKPVKLTTNRVAWRLEDVKAAFAPEATAQ